MSSLYKVALVTTAATAAAVTQEQVFGIPSSVLLASFVGAFLGLAYSPPETWARLIPDKNSRWYMAATKVSFQLFGLTFSITANGIVSGWVVVSAPAFFKLAASVPVEPAAGLLAFAAQHLIPKVFVAAGVWLETRARK